MLSLLPQGPGSSRCSGFWWFWHGDGERHHPGAGTYSPTQSQDVEGEEHLQCDHYCSLQLIKLEMVCLSVWLGISHASINSLHAVTVTVPHVRQMSTDWKDQHLLLRWHTPMTGSVWNHIPTTYYQWSMCTNTERFFEKLILIFFFDCWQFYRFIKTIPFLYVMK